MKICSILKVITVSCFLIIVISGCNRYSDTKTFMTTDFAPEGFDAWTFFWKAPQINPEADFHLTVYDPAENEYAYWNREDEPIYKNADRRTDFGKGELGGDPATLHNKEIKIVFRVNKGEILFDATERYYFKFYILLV